ERGQVTLTQSTISGNRATGLDAGGGGAWFFRPRVTIAASTITENFAQGIGGGVGTEATFSSQTLTIHHSILAGNVDGGTAPEFVAPYEAETRLDVRYSLIGDNTGTGLASAA